VLAPPNLMSEFRKVHQFNVFTVNTPCQLGIAEYMRDASRHLGLAAFYEGQARVLPRQLRGFALRVAALPRHLLSTGALQRDLRPA
jgi:methionine aminotransferase